MTPVQKTKTIFGLFLAALIGAGVIYFFQNRSGGQEPFRVTEEGEFFKIQVESPDGDYILENREGRWWVTDPFEDWAEFKVVNALLDAFQKMEIGSVISENPDRYEQFAIGEGDARRIRVFLKGKKKPSLDAYFGKKATSGYGSTYFRWKGSEEVHILLNFPVYLLARFPDDFRQVLLLPEDPSKVDRISWAEKGTAVTVEKSSHSWHFEGEEKTLPPQAFQEFFSQWKSFRSIGPAEGIVPEEKPVHVLRVSGEASVVISVFLKGAPDPGQVLVQVEGRPNLLKVPKKQFEELWDAWQAIENG